VLDVACGTGVVTRAAAEQVGPTGSVTGIDIAPDMIAVAKTVPAGGAPITWQEADAASLPLPDEFYDVGLCQMGLMFMKDRAGALRELHRVLTPGGRVVINTPGRIQPLFKAMEQAIADNLDPTLSAFVSAVFSMHDPSVLADLLRQAGFGDVTSQEYKATFDLPGPAEFDGAAGGRCARGSQGGDGAAGRRSLDALRRERSDRCRAADGAGLGREVLKPESLDPSTIQEGAQHPAQPARGFSWHATASLWSPLDGTTAWQWSDASAPNLSELVSGSIGALTSR
jgi:SAM-dependent methyltransferase